MIKEQEAALTVAEVCRKHDILWPAGECLVIADRQPFRCTGGAGVTAMVRIYGQPGCIVSDRRRSENDPGDRFSMEGPRVPQHGVPQPRDPQWAGDIGVAWHDIDPAKPQRNGLIESFYGSLRPISDASIACPTMNACLNEEIFDRLAGATRSWPSVSRALQGADPRTLSVS